MFTSLGLVYLEFDWRWQISRSHDWCRQRRKPLPSRFTFDRSVWSPILSGIHFIILNFHFIWVLVRIAYLQCANVDLSIFLGYVFWCNIWCRSLMWIWNWVRAGLVYNLTEYLSSHGINIESLETYTQEVRILATISSCLFIWTFLFKSLFDLVRN